MEARMEVAMALNPRRVVAAPSNVKVMLVESPATVAGAASVDPLGYCLKPAWK